GFKPRAANDYWLHHDEYRAVLRRGRLHGRDARRLAAVGDIEDPRAINPVHRLWQPAPGGGTGLLGVPDAEFVLDRAGGTYVRNETVEPPPGLADAFPLEDAIGVGTLEECNAVMEDHHLPATEALAGDIEAAGDAVVESYQDVANPLGIEFDRVAVVEPMRVRVYEGGRYRRACRAAGRSHREGRLEATTDDVTSAIDPLRVEPLVPLTGPQREDPAEVAAAYGAAYDAVLE
ncbi:MAG: ATPase, partial [Halobacteriales archaeon]